MKQKAKIFILLFTVAFIVGLNVRHALNDYGVKENKIHSEIMAQDTGGGGTGTGSGTETGSGEVGITCDQHCNGCSGICWTGNDKWDETMPISKRCIISGKAWLSCNCGD